MEYKWDNCNNTGKKDYTEAILRFLAHYMAAVILYIVLTREYGFNFLFTMIAGLVLAGMSYVGRLMMIRVKSKLGKYTIWATGAIYVSLYFIFSVIIERHSDTIGSICSNAFSLISGIYIFGYFAYAAEEVLIKVCNKLFK